MYPDEELARPAEIGRHAHQVIALLAQRHTTISPQDIHESVTAALHAYRPIEARAHRQNMTSGVFCFFRFLLPPTEWRFVGAEVALGPGRIDLLWRDVQGRMLLDEVKTGSSRQLLLSRTHRQVQTYLDCAIDTWGDRLTGLRLLSTSDPGRSLFFHADGRHEPLLDTPYRRTP